MRTTLTLSDDVASKAKARAAAMRRPFKDVINEALRMGLEAMDQARPAKSYRTKPRPMGLREGLSYDNIGDLLAAAEREDFR